MIVVAANSVMPAHPAWYLNLSTTRVPSSRSKAARCRFAVPMTIAEQPVSGDPLLAEQDVGRHRGTQRALERQRLKRVVAGELLVPPRGRVEAVDDATGEITPARRLIDRDAGALGDVGGRPEVPPRHDVGVGVVVDVRVVLVGTDHAVDVRPTIVVDVAARGPVARGLHEQRAGRAEQELRVPCPRRVMDRRPGGPR